MKRISPLIESLAWGSISGEGVGSVKDLKLWPGGGREWDWNETDTHHSPGIQPADVAELVENGCETIVLSRGMLQRLLICGETLSLLNRKGIGVHLAETKEAVKIYNDLAGKGVAVGGLFHSTC